MSKQKKGEYKGKELADESSEMCSELCSYIEKAFNAILKYFEGNIKMVLLSEFGIEINEYIQSKSMFIFTYSRLLVQHFKKFQVSLSGGLVFLK